MAYCILAECKNCGWADEIEIMEGELVEKQECPICKCREVTKQYGATARRKIKK